MSALSRAVAGLSGSLKRVAGEAAVYTRGPATSLSFTVVHDLQSYEVINDQGFPESVISHDFLIAVGDIPIATGDMREGLIGGPRGGDRITVDVAGVGCEFEVVPVGKRPCVELADPDGIILVVHTKKVA